MSTAQHTDQGRRAFARKAWADACTQLSAADAETTLAPDDLERLGVAAYLIGQEDVSEAALSRAHQVYRENRRYDQAARCAFWLGMGLIDRGETARGGGWLARAQRAVEDHPEECVEAGYLLVPAGLRGVAEGDLAAARTSFERAAEIAARFGDPDLVTLARLGQGQVKVLTGDARGGLRLFDEIMVAVIAGEVSPIPAGIVYCAVIAGCHECFDMRRAQEWTAALNTWCESQPDLVPYRGQCLVHRAQVLQWHGSWADALDEARRAGEWLSRPSVRPAIGAAFYQQAEILRLRGDFAAAEEAYRRASEFGHEVQPGFALLRLAQGRVDAAEAALRRVVDVGDAAAIGLLPAYVETMLAAGHVDAARAGADRLQSMAADREAPLLRAGAAHARGAVLLAEGEPAGALSCLRDAAASWHDLDAPYELARARVLVALACRAVGDEDSAQLELAAATRTFRELGARPDLEYALSLVTPAGTSTGPLTRREVEVLRLVAAGKTNRSIADELFLSEKTIARHLSNIFTKLGVSTRSAATAYAYRNDLV